MASNALFIVIIITIVMKKDCISLRHELPDGKKKKDFVSN
jgi:hypothetical protein